jgi:hypothetical protein
MFIGFPIHTIETLPRSSMPLISARYIFNSNSYFAGNVIEMSFDTIQGATVMQIGITNDPIKNSVNTPTAFEMPTIYTGTFFLGELIFSCHTASPVICAQCDRPS